MRYCSNCGKSVYSQSNECPECGKILPDTEGNDSAGKRKLPRIVGEETNRPVKQPLTSSAQYQQPVHQQEYQQHQYQEQPQPAFQQNYYQSNEQRRPEKAGILPLILVIIGGILAMVCAMAVFRTSIMGFTSYIDIGSVDVKFAYLLLVPISGMLALLFGFFGYLTQKRQMALIIMVLGIMALVIPLIFAAHLSSEGNLSFGEVFYVSEETGFGSSFSNIFIGGILAMIGGIFLIIGGFMFFMKTEKSEMPVKVRQPRDY